MFMGKIFPSFLEWRIESSCSSTRMVRIYQPTRRHSPEDRDAYSTRMHHRNNFKYHNFKSL